MLLSIIILMMIIELIISFDCYSVFGIIYLDKEFKSFKKKDRNHEKNYIACREKI